MVALLRVLLRAVGEHNPVSRGAQMLTHQQDVGPGGQFATFYQPALLYECQPVEKCNKLLCGSRVADV